MRADVFASLMSRFKKLEGEMKQLAEEFAAGQNSNALTVSQKIAKIENKQTDLDRQLHCKLAEIDKKCRHELNGLSNVIKSMARNNVNDAMPVENIVITEKGDPGLSAYEIWVNAGNIGTEKDFLDSLVGKDGIGIREVFISKSYDLIVVYNNDKREKLINFEKAILSIIAKNNIGAGGGSGNGITIAMVRRITTSVINEIIGNYVPYTGATENVDLGAFSITASNFSGSSSGINTGDQTITLIGDITGSGTGTITTTLPTVNSNVGTWGGFGVYPVVTVNAKGLVTKASNISLQGVTNQINLSTTDFTDLIFSTPQDIDTAADFQVGELMVGNTTRVSTAHIYESTTNTGTSAGLTIEQGSTGDAMLQFLLTGGTRLQAGIDNSNGDSWTEGFSSSLGTTPHRVVTTAGEQIMPLQPGFFAYNSAFQNNVTGDGTPYTVLFDTEVVDQNADYDPTTGIFTAPVTAKGYEFHSTVLVAMGGTTTVELRLVTSNHTYVGSYRGSAKSADGYSALSVTCLSADMDVTDTAKIQVVDFNSTKVDDIWGGTNTLFRTHFSGHLAY